MCLYRSVCNWFKVVGLLAEYDMEQLQAWSLYSRFYFKGMEQLLAHRSPEATHSLPACSCCLFSNNTEPCAGDVKESSNLQRKPLRHTGATVQWRKRKKNHGCKNKNVPVLRGYVWQNKKKSGLRLPSVSRKMVGRLARARQTVSRSKTVTESTQSQPRVNPPTFKSHPTRCKKNVLVPHGRAGVTGLCTVDTRVSI